MKVSAIYAFTLLTIGFFLILVNACIKPPSYSIIPAITFDTLYPIHVNEVSDTVWMKVSFTDGDGDIGVKQDEADADFFLTDSRTGFVYENAIPYVQPKGNVKAVSGDFTYSFPGLTCRPEPGRTLDTLHFSIYITDRAGNKSNVIETPDIFLDCQ